MSEAKYSKRYGSKSNAGRKFNLFQYLVGKKGKSKFGSSTTSEEVVKSWDGSGKCAIVTGAFTGLGLHVSRVLASRGCEVVMAGRGRVRGGKIAKDYILRDIPDARVRILQLDLSSFDSIRQFVEDFLSLNLPLDILVNNAGVLGLPFSLSKDGYEMNFATNHLGHFLLSNLLLEKLCAGSTSAAPARVVNVASFFHEYSYKSGILPEDQLNSPDHYNREKAYAQTKLANILFTKELNERLEREGKNVISVALSPGCILTGLQRHYKKNVGNAFINYVGTSLVRPFFKSISQGAATIAYCCTNDKIMGGEYYYHCNLGICSDQASDKEKGSYLWNLSEKYCGLI